MKLTNTHGRPSAFRSSLMYSPTRSSTGSPDSVLRSIGEKLALLLDDESCCHPEHALVPLYVGEDVAVPDPDTRVFQLHQDRVALTWGNVEGVDPIRTVQRDAILGVHKLTELMLVHRVDLQAFVEVMD